MDTSYGNLRCAIVAIERGIKLRSVPAKIPLCGEMAAPAEGAEARGIGQIRAQLWDRREATQGAQRWRSAQIRPEMRLKNGETDGPSRARRARG